ncbi:MAG: helicase C-terminal domain-containing protein [Nanoarchaeota archaeon]
MSKSGDQHRLQSLQTNVVKTWKPKETVILPDDFLLEQKGNLKDSSSLSFLKETKEENRSDIFSINWDLNDEKGKIPPLKFSNNKTQEDVVNEILNLIKEGSRIIFLHGACGTGKSAIALNVARKLGKSSIIVPVKALQRQYEDDYTEKKFFYKSNGQKMKIAVMTGRENHDSIINQGVSCADPELPENIKISEKNYLKIADHFRNNPFVSGQDVPDYKHIRRLSIAPANPYWSPIVPSSYDLNQLKDAKKIKYEGCDGREYTFYHRKSGCSYYDQYLAYKNADVIVFNGAKYKAELSIGRKPATEIEIIDESDEFLDSLFQQEDINLTRLANSLTSIVPESPESRETIKEILTIINLEEQNKRALGVDENEVYNLDNTKIRKIFKLLIKNKELESEILIDDQNYSNKALELARSLEEMTEEVYLTYRKEEESLYVKLVSTNLSQKIAELLDKSKVLLFMSGTLHSQNVIKNIFGMSNFKIVEAETLQQGAIEIMMTGKEKDCKYSNFSEGQHSRKEYLEALNLSVEKAKRPTLIHVNAFQDLPTDEEKVKFKLSQLTSQESLIEQQREDKTGRAIAIFKQGLNDKLFTTKCSRGIDFPGNMCNSVVFTKYPNPNISDTFWKILQKTHPDHFWEFYRDKAYREFLQRIYRAVRSKDDHVYILSPDIRVLQSVRKLQNEKI